MKEDLNKLAIIIKSIRNTVWSGEVNKDDSERLGIYVSDLLDIFLEAMRGEK